MIEVIEKTSGIVVKKENVEEQPGDVRQTWADISKANELLEYSANYVLEKGLSIFGKWYRKKNDIKAKIETSH